MKNLSRNLLVFFILLGTSLSGQDLTTKQAPLPCINKKFTIVAHIVKDTFGNPLTEEADVSSAMESVNELFEPICVSFEICEFRYIDNFQYASIFGNKPEEMRIKYHQANRINMYFVGLINKDTSVCGNATLGGITQLNGGGVNIKCVGSGTIAHELGHYFGLKHTFEGSGIELVDGSNCETVADGICDTPADPYVAGDDLIEYVDNNCRFISLKTDANGQFYEPDVGNVMSYYPCSCGFTYGQYLLMANTYLASPNMW